MWHILWNVMAVVGILFSVSCLILFLAYILGSINDKKE